MLKNDIILDLGKNIVSNIRFNVTFDSYYKLHGDPIGYGTTAVVFEGTSLKTGKEVAVKIMLKEDIDIDLVQQEINILRTLNHPNIIKLYDIFETPNEMYIVMNLCKGQSLLPRILKCHHFAEKTAVKIIKCLLETVSYLHQNGIVHRDIKPENILFEDDSPNSKIYLADFGFSKKQNKNQLMSTMVGTWAFVSPDVILTLNGKSKYTSKTDIWSIGAVTYLILFGEIPFKHALSNDQMTEELVISLYNDQVSQNVNLASNSVSEQAKDFIMKCLEPNPCLRLSAEEALSHPWILMAESLNSHLAQTVSNLETFSNNLAQCSTIKKRQEEAEINMCKSINVKDLCTLYSIHQDV